MTDAVRRVAIFAFDGCQGLDVMGPLEVFHGLNHALDRRGAKAKGYDVMVAGAGRFVRTDSGVRIGTDVTLARLSRPRAAPIDTFLGPGVRETVGDASVRQAIVRCARRARRTGSVCTGAFLLAASGLLEGRRATTHWAYCDVLAQHFPETHVEREPLFVEDEGIWTTAGVTAGVDLALAFVADDFGPELASEVARWLVVHVRRAGGQPQVSAQLRAQSARRPDVRDVLTWIDEHLADDLSLTTLARRARMSVRNFARVFHEQTGASAAAYVERVRLEAARRDLESSDQSIDEVAVASGFGRAERLRRVFARRMGTSPNAYRAQARARR